MNWLSLILALLSLVGSLFNWAREKQLLKQGADAEVAKATMKVLEMTAEGQRLLTEIKAKHDKDLDEFLKELGGD